ADEAGSFHALRGPDPKPAPFEPAGPEARTRLQEVRSWPGRIALGHGTAVLPLWPLLLYAPPPLLDPPSPGLEDCTGRPAAQISDKKGKLSLHFLPFGGAEICQSAGDEAAWEEFHRLFPPVRTRPSGAGFEEELTGDARHVVGREPDIAAVHA